MNDLISRQAAIDALEQIFDRCEEIEAHLPEGDPDRTGYKMYPDYMTVWKYLHQLPSEQPDLDSAYTEGYTQAEAKYRKMWDEMQSAQPEPQWIPCKTRLPEDLEEVNVTWVNHKPESYYEFAKDKPFTASAVYYKGDWYWYSSTCADILGEYGKNDIEKVDYAIEIVAWMPLPEAYKEVTE